MLFSRKQTSTRRAASKKKFRRLLVEQMEQRCMFVVGAFDIPAPVNPGAGYDGVVRLNSDLGSCTGSLLGGGQHILTAAHCVTDGSGNINVSDLDVTFEMPTSDIVFNVDISKIDVHPSWTGATTSVGDLAVLTLDALAPVRAERYRLYGDQAGDAESIGQIFTLVGYGVTGTGATGQQAGTGGTKRLAFNQIGQIGPAASQLRADFDDGVTDTLGDGFGLGALEGDQASGDSGGPSMLIGNAVAGIASYSTDFNSSGNNSDFGDWFTATRVSSFLGYIQGIRDAAGPLVIDMNLQEEGNDGTADRISMRRDGSDIVVSFSGLGEVLRRPFGLTTEIQVIGSQDTDTLIINEDNGRVIPTGGVRFDGGSGSGTDSLEYIGSSVQNVNYYPDGTNFGDGRIQVTGAGNIDFENLEPITISAVLALGIFTTNSQDDLRLDSPAAGQNRLSGTTGGVGLEPITFFDIPTVVVDMSVADVPGSDSDRFVMDAPGFEANLLTNFRIVGGTGSDFFSVIGHPVVRVDVQGGAPQNFDPGVPPGDTLAVDATGFAMVNAPRNQPNGVVNAVGMAPISYSSIESLVVSDAFESNNRLATATVLGSEPEVTLRDLSIHNSTDSDWFQVTANQTGKLAINVFFKHAVGNLDVGIFDASGNLIAGSFTASDNEQVVIPVVGQEVYYILVLTIAGAVNNYALEIENFALPVPVLTDLVRSSDTGESWSDNVTRDNTPTLDVLVDLVTFTADVTSGGTFLNAAQAVVPTTGFGVVIAITDAATGVVVDSLLDPVGITSSLWRQTTAALPDGTYLIAAAAYVIDGQNTKAYGNGAFGAPLVLTIDTADPTGDPVDLATESDSGFSDSDNVTSIRTPTFEGVAEPGAILRLIAGTRFVGTTVVGSDESDGIIGNNRGRFSVQSSALDDGLYNIRYTLEDLAGNVFLSNDFLPIQIDTVAPNTPYLDIPSNFDTGRNDEDNVTRINTLLLSLTTHNAGPVPPQIFANNLIYRVFVRPEVGNEVLVFDSSVAVGAPTALTHVFTTANLLTGTTTLPALPDGAHNFKLEVEDRAGNISEDFLLPFVIDTLAPPAPTLRLDPAVTDTGVGFDPGTLIDNITAASTPGFYGRAEANTIVRLAADTASNNVINASDVAIGLTQTIPLDGNDAFPQGQYRLTSVRDLNNPADAFPRDGLRQIGATAEDLAGNISAATFLDIAIDTTPPQVTAVDFLNGQSVFAPKPLAGVTPRVDSIQVTFRDSRPAGLPAIFDIDGVDLTQAAISGNYIVRGDHTGRALIDSVTVISSAAGVVTVRLNFAAPLQDDRYTLEISEDISDPTGNLLDGDSRSSEPGLAVALLPSGNQIPGGNFAGRFTVDSRPEVGTVAQGIAYIDINGNNQWDPHGLANDATNRDFVLQMGTLTDAHFAGNFAKVGAASASGFDKLGVYGRFGATYSFAFDTNDDGVADVASVMPAEYQVNGIPVAGNFNAAHPGDEIGLFDGSFWYLDLNGNNQIDVGERIASNFTGLPVVGDFNGDGSDDLATYNNDTNTFLFDTNRDGQVDFQLNVRDALGRWGGLGGFTDRPVAGDLNLDGVDDLGLWVKGRGGQPPLATGEFFFWLSDRISPNPANNFDSYSPSPLGNDLFTQFGNDSALPIFGNFDPPVQENPANPATGNLLHRSSNPMDANGDNFVSPLDVLVVINVLNSGSPVPTFDQVRAFATVGGNTVDVDNDRQVSPLDALVLINFINSRGTGGEGEGTAVAVSDKPSSSQIDEFFSWYDEDEEWLPNRRRRSQ